MTLAVDNEALVILDSALAFYIENEYFGGRPEYYERVKALKDRIQLSLREPEVEE